MRAAVVTGPGRLRIDEVVRPEPSEGAVRVRLIGCGVCASNLEPWAGPDWMTFPTEPGALGHEGWGVIETLGAGVTGLGEGQPVAVLSHHAYADCDTAPAEAVVPLPEALAGQMFPGEALGCAMNIFARSRIEAGQTVAVVGLGFLGAILTQLAARAGARVIGVSRREFARATGMAMGAAEALDIGDHEAVVARIEALTEGSLCDRVIEVTGKQGPLDLAARIAGVRGRLVIAGYHQDGPRQVDMQLWNWRGLDVVNAHERDPAVYMAGMREAVAALSEGRLDLEGLITHSFPLEELGAALDATRDRPEDFLKAVVTL